MHYDTSEKSWQITGKRGKWARLGQKNLKLNSSDRTKRGHELKLKVRKLKNAEKVLDLRQTDNQTHWACERDILILTAISAGTRWERHGEQLYKICETELQNSMLKISSWWMWEKQFCIAADRWRLEARLRPEFGINCVLVREHADDLQQGTG